MDTCKNCHWWGQTYPGACGRTDTLGKASSASQRFSVQARADDDQGLEAWLQTGPDFGCVLFSPKAPPNTDHLEIVDNL